MKYLLRVRFKFILSLSLIAMLLSACELPYGTAPLPRLAPVIPLIPHNCQPISDLNGANIELLSEVETIEQNPVVAFAISDDNKRITMIHTSSVNHPGVIQIWDIAQKQIVQRFEIDWIHPRLTHLSQNGILLATQEDRAESVDQRRSEFPGAIQKRLTSIIDIWDISTGQKQTARPQPAQILDIDISPDGGKLLTGDSIGSVDLMSTDPDVTFGGEGLLLLTGKGAQIPVVVSFDRSGETYAYATMDGELGIRPIVDKLKTEIGIIAKPSGNSDKGKPLDLDFDPSRTWLAVLNEQSIEVLDIQTILGWSMAFEAKHSFTSSGKVFFSPSSLLIVVTTDYDWRLIGGNNWNVIISQRTKGISSVGFSKDGCLLVLGMTKGTVQVWGIK